MKLVKTFPRNSMTSERLHDIDLLSVKSNGGSYVGTAELQHSLL